MLDVTAIQSFSLVTGLDVIIIKNTIWELKLTSDIFYTVQSEGKNNN